MLSFLNTPRTWAISEEGMCSLVSAYQKAEAGITLADFFTPRKSLRMENGVALIDVKGALLDKPPAIHEKVGGTDYRTLRAEIAQAQEAGAQAFLFSFDSPGGSVAGLAEVADIIANLEQPTLAYADGLCCSAAYYLAAGCDSLISSASAPIGNIGTVLSWHDFSGMFEKMGVKTETITNTGADLKGTFRQNPMPEEQRAFLQDQCDQIGAEFRSHVEAHRNVDAEVFRAGWYHGANALELGLCDGVGSLEDVLLDVAATLKSPTQ